MACVPAPACRAALTQATALVPARSKASDGLCPGPNHPPTGDHPRGNAFDATHDPFHGFDAHAWVRLLIARRDQRVKYAISQGMIANHQAIGGHPAWAWREYDGVNDHYKHAHVSIHQHARDDTSPWWVAPPIPIPEDDDMARRALQIKGENSLYVITEPRRAERITSPARFYVLAAGGFISGDPQFVLDPAKPEHSAPIADLRTMAATP